MSTRTQGLNDIMEFDHVVIVHKDGSITDAPRDQREYWAPELYDDELTGEGWDFFTHGYSGQDRYSGPIMHNSEYIGGRLEQDIRSTPGTYVALVSYYSADADGNVNENETYAEGWAIARKVED